MNIYLYFIDRMYLDSSLDMIDDKENDAPITSTDGKPPPDLLIKLEQKCERILLAFEQEIDKLENHIKKLNKDLKKAHDQLQTTISRREETKKQFTEKVNNKMAEWLKKQ